MTDKLTGDRISEQLEVIEQLRDEFSHGIRVEQEAIEDQPKTWQYTCFQYALGCVDPPRVVWVLANAFPDDVYLSPNFVAYLIEHHLREITAAEAAEGDLVIYFDASGPTHAGILRGEEVVSKWGTVHLWRHGLWEVPESYGDAIRYFQPVSTDQVAGAFVEFASEQVGADALRPFIAR